MSKTNSELVSSSLNSLKGKWGLVVGAVLLNAIIISAASKIPYTLSLGSMIITGPLQLGMAIFTLSVFRNEASKIELLFKGFNNFATSLTAYLLTVLYTLLWSLLLIVPGVIKSLSYSMTMYIIADESTISAQDAITKSMKMMDGFKLKLFLLKLRFIAIPFVVILTSVGIAFSALYPIIIGAALGNFDFSNFFNENSLAVIIPLVVILVIILLYLLFLLPLMQIACAAFYEDIKPKEYEFGIAE